MKDLHEYSADLRRARPDSVAAFMCPVCLREFNIETTGASSIARAHVFPKAVGGKHKTRACKVCDERIGDKVEGPVVSILKSHRIVTGLTFGPAYCRAKMSIGHLTASAHVSFGDGGLEIEIPKRGAFDGLPALLGVEVLHDTPGPVPFRHCPPIKLTLTSFTADLADLARVLALKIAYYTAFEQYGYSYILRKDLDWVRSVLQDPLSRGAPCVHSVQLCNNPFAPAGDYPVTSLCEAETDKMRGLLCVAGFWNVGFMTMLPPLESPSDDWLGVCDLGPWDGARATFPSHLIERLREAVKSNHGGR